MHAWSLRSNPIQRVICRATLTGSRRQQTRSPYKRASMLFSETHWMTNSIFVFYLEWLHKTIPDKCTLLIVDDWLLENHPSSLPGDIYIAYFQDGMATIQQVCDEAVSKPRDFHKEDTHRVPSRDSRGRTAKELLGCVVTVTVPREVLIEVLRIRSIQSTLKTDRGAGSQCGQEP